MSRPYEADGCVTSFVSESLRLRLRRSSISLGLRLLLSRWPPLVLGRSTSLACAGSPSSVHGSILRLTISL